MTNNNVRKGSELEAENKRKTALLIALAMVTLLIGLCLFVFNTDLRAFSNRAGLFCKLAGGALLAGSWYSLYWGAKNEADGKFGIVWFILLVFSVLVSCGFNFDYFGVK